MRTPFILFFLTAIPFLGGCASELKQGIDSEPTTPTPEICGDSLEEERITIFLDRKDDSMNVFAFGPAETIAPLVPSKLCVRVQIPTCSESWQLSVKVSTTDGFKTLDPIDGEGATQASHSHAPCVSGPPAETLLHTYTATLTHIVTGKVVEHQGTFSALPMGLDAVSLAVDTTGGLWAGTIRNGLVGVNGAEVSHFPGVALSASFDPTFNGPQANAVPSLLVDDSGDALWVGSFITGVSRLDLATHQWRHFDLTPGEAMNESPVVPIELAQTPLALLQDGSDSLWVGTANGLYHMTVDASDSASFERATNGVIQAMGRRLEIDGRPQELWLGHSTEAKPSAEDAPFWPKQNASLTVVHPDETERAAVAELSLAVPGEVVLSLLVTDTYALVGTDQGLFRAELTPGEATTIETSFVAVSLAAVTGEVTPVITALADDGAGGAWVGVVFECEVDGGALVHVHADGSVTDHSAPTGIDRDVATLARLADGTLVVSTHTIKIVMGTPFTSCQPFDAERIGDVYLVTPDTNSGGTWEPLR